METILSKEQMNLMQEMSKVTLQISEAKNTLSKLKEEEFEYLNEREAKALKRLDALYKKSDKILSGIKENNTEVSEFIVKIRSYLDFVEDVQGKLSDSVQKFNDRNELWEENIKIKENELARQVKLIEIDKKHIQQEKEQLESIQKRIDEDKKLIESRQKTLSESYKVEKELWNKLKQN